MHPDTLIPSTRTSSEAGLNAPAGDYEALIAGLRDKDRSNVERHVAFCEAEPSPDHARLWKRLVCSLALLASKAFQTTGSRAVQFYAADGAYRMQVFALEDPRDGTLLVYLPDVLEQAIRAGTLSGPRGDDAGGVRLYHVAGEPYVALMIESLTAAQTTSAPAYYRHMLGWNRKAIRITLPTSATSAQVKAVEVLCALAAPQQSGHAPPAR